MKDPLPAGEHPIPDIPELPAGLVALGIEVGSLYFKVVGLAPGSRPRFHYKRPHLGAPLRLLTHFQETAAKKHLKLGASGNGTALASADCLDAVVCLQAAVSSRYPDARNILEVGAGHLLLVRLGEGGRILSIHRNSLCASGTGSFLDAQAGRMGVDYGDFNHQPTAESPPSIATRCAVFAKSDLIYRQQEGVSKEALWSGLCRGVVDGLLHALTKGRPLSGPTVLCGGVALNQAVVWWLRQRTGNGSGPVHLTVMSRPEYAVALGAALLATDGGRVVSPARPRADAEPERQKRPALRLRRSRYLAGQESRAEVDGEGNEVAVHQVGSNPLSGEVAVHLGIDIGSTSTKLALVDAANRVVLDIYRATGADPVAAVQKLFQAAAGAARRTGCRFRVRGAAVTGSGRKLIAPIIGADLVVNEISAHVAGAVACDPGVETIFEIGGQDAKYMSVREGRIVDANMNYVCAAGTGSFIEELAAKLGYRVAEIGEAALGAEPPFTSTRCTVFMEQDILHLLHRGVSRREAAGAVMYSIIENYLERVVGRRPVSADRVFFQGATARNRGLVAAIENILDVEVFVSPLCHVMGALGAALLAKDKLNGRPTTFRGLDLGERSVAVEHEDCTLCTNRCRLARAVIEAEPDRPLWGMKCGRDEADGRMKAMDGLALFRAAGNPGRPADGAGPEPAGRPVVALPRALALYSHFDFWQAFFRSLGIEARLGQAGNRGSIELGVALSGPDFCLPLKAAVGQAAALLRDENRPFVFIPYALADRGSPGLSHSRFCPYVETLPSLVQAALAGNGFDLSRVVSPVVDFRLADEVNARNIAAAFDPFFPVDWKDAAAGLARGRDARRRRGERLAAEGRRSIERTRAEGKPAVVIIGRPYSVLDDGLNQDIPRAIARGEVTVIPLDGLPYDPGLLEGEFRNLFWATGQRLLSALLQVAGTEGLYAVYLSNFGCGPDSFLVSYAEMIMGEKPLLVLEVDEHGASGGYETRVEAFLDVIRKDWEERRVHRVRPVPPAEPAADIRSRRIWLPSMHPVGVRTMAAAFRAEGYDARPLPLEDESTFSLGKRWTRGAECLPMSLTLGAFLSQVEKDRSLNRHPEKEAALFLPTSAGPCRFGQYRTLDRIIFERLKMDEIPILSPGAHNAYYGLPKRLRPKIWKSIVGGDALFKMGCRVRPYETHRGDTEEALETWTARAEALVESNRIKWPVFLEEAMAGFLKIPVAPKPRPIVGIVGEVYVRCNSFANNRLVEAIEQAGGEAWLSPVSEWILYTAWIERYLSRAQKAGPLDKLGLALKWRYVSGQEHALYRRLLPLLGDRLEPSMDDIIRAGRRMLPPEFQGESIITLGRAVLFGRDGADLVVNCAPFGCMPGNITSAIFEQRRDETGVPVVSIFYDGTEDNSVINGFLHEALRKAR